MKTRDAARGRWSEIFDYFGLPKFNPKVHYKGECPFCKRNGCLRVDNRTGEGDWISNCRQPGIGFDLVQAWTNYDFRKVSDEIDQLLGNTFDAREDNKEQNQRQQARKNRLDALRERWRETERLPNTMAQDYWRARGIERLPQSQHVRFMAQEQGKHAGKSGIWSLALDQSGTPAYLHRTLLRNGEKVFRQLDRLISEDEAEWIGSVHVPLFPVSSVLGVAEGIEDALSANQMYGVNVWSTINAGFLAKFKAPRGVEKLIIYADNDPHSMAGLVAATTCANRNILDKNSDVQEVVICYPAEVKDFNNLINNPGPVRRLPSLTRKKT